MNDLRERLATMTPEELKAESFEREIEEWRVVNRFCGKCGASMLAQDAQLGKLHLV